jgi:hypothetical protein
MTQRMTLRMTRWLAFFSALLLTACQTLPTESVPTPAKPELAFVDLQSFDRDLSTALASQLPRINVVFYDKVAPSALPERLQHWMASVEAGGGKVRVVPPTGSVTAKDPFLLISAISAVWNAKRLATAASASNLLRPARDYDVSIVLKADSQEGSVLDQLVFVPRSK